MEPRPAHTLLIGRLHDEDRSHLASTDTPEEITHRRITAPERRIISTEGTGTDLVGQLGRQSDADETGDGRPLAYRIDIGRLLRLLGVKCRPVGAGGKTESEGSEEG